MRRHIDEIEITLVVQCSNSSNSSSSASSIEVATAAAARRSNSNFHPAFCKIEIRFKNQHFPEILFSMLSSIDEAFSKNSLPLTFIFALLLPFSIRIEIQKAYF